MSSSASEFGSSSSSSDSDDEILGLVLQAASICASSSHQFFTSHEWLEEKQQCVDPSRGVSRIMDTLLATPYLFKTLTNFTAAEFEEFSSIWNWSRSSVNDDALFVSSCINVAAADELRWPTREERRRLAATLPQFPGCIGFIDGTLCKIRRPFQDPLHRNWYNGRKKIYSVNNTVVVDHSGLFIFIDSGYPGKFHDVSILRESDLYKNWRDYFQHDDDYFEYLLGDPGYVGEEQFIMRRVGQREAYEGDDQSVINQFNKMHAGFRVRVEWGIGGLKGKWRRLMKRFDCTKQKFPYLFKSACIMTNFLHRRRMDMQFECIGEQRENAEDFGWDGDY
ncbi:hypothetical protein R1sor_018946 [Riccia sorocarpa]|uniref:DDE Tnp4 domain-containing protein n=1 Tax=Riccia sorocarpa TaxID=122646 RepID=A0ABD3IHD4_9MARC